MFLIVSFASFWLGQAHSLNVSCISENQLQCYADETPCDQDSFIKTSFGRVFPNVLASKTVGKHGPILLQEVYLVEKLQKLNRQNIPIRGAHGKGSGAFGYFEATRDVSRYTKAKFLKLHKKTKVAVRFSTQVGETATADTDIDLKGFAVKFYTEDGNYDFTGINIPVFGNRDATITTDLTRARKKNPVTHQRDPNMYWDIASERPETTLFTLFFFSRTSYVKSYRFIDGHAIHTFKLVNRKNKPTYAKLIFTSDTVNKTYFTTPGAVVMAGINPDYLSNDLYDNIAKGNFPTWTLNLQLMTYEQAKTYRYNIFDSTKFWNTTEFPLIPVGKLTLNRNPNNYFSDVEQAAYAPTNMVPGIEPTPDRLLEARMFAYRDAQMYRLGVNHDQIPVNRCPFGYKNYEQDGAMNVGPNNDNGPNYYPNTFHGPTNNRDAYYNDLPFHVTGDVDRIDLGDLEDNFSQSQAYYNSLSADEQKNLAMNMAFSFLGVYERIMQKAINKMLKPVSENLVKDVFAAFEKVKLLPVPN